MHSRCCNAAVDISYSVHRCVFIAAPPQQFKILWFFNLIFFYVLHPLKTWGNNWLELRGPLVKLELWSHPSPQHSLFTIFLQPHWPGFPRHHRHLSLEAARGSEHLSTCTVYLQRDLEGLPRRLPAPVNPL